MMQLAPTKSERDWRHRSYPCPRDGRRVNLWGCLDCADLQGAGMACGREKPFTRREVRRGAQ